MMCIRTCPSHLQSCQAETLLAGLGNSECHGHTPGAGAGSDCKRTKRGMMHMCIRSI